MTESRLEFRGDFADFNCLNCFSKNRVTVKDEVKEFYFCSYCGLKMRVTG